MLVLHQMSISITTLHTKDFYLPLIRKQFHTSKKVHFKSTLGSNTDIMTLKLLWNNLKQMFPYRFIFSSSYAWSYMMTMIYSLQDLKILFTFLLRTLHCVFLVHSLLKAFEVAFIYTYILHNKLT